jgi:AraC family transcriptional regulator
LHWHKRAFLSVLLNGSYLEECGPSTLFCDAGQAIFHAADELHSNRFFESGGWLLNLEILPHFADRLRAYGLDTRTRLELGGGHSTQLGFKIHSEASRFDSVSELAIEGAAMELLSGMVRNSTAASSLKRTNWLKRVNSYLAERYREPITLKDLGEYAGVHPVYLTRAFRKHHRCSVGDYIRRLRIDSACRELATLDIPIAEVAARNGFSDQSHLCHSVKQHVGVSPSALRRLRQERNPQQK